MIYGAGDRSRTRDLLITNQLLYRLSYASVRMDRAGIVCNRSDAGNLRGGSAVVSVGGSSCKAGSRCGCVLAAGGGGLGNSLSSISGGGWSSRVSGPKGCSTAGGGWL